jgi:glycine/D-amino acid oxidase-like deaminating enzyme
MDVNPEPPLHPPQEKHIIILGAGISALSTSLALSLSQTSYTLTLIASHLPNSSNASSIEYTSPKAGGHWRSFATLSSSDSQLREWDKSTYESWMARLGNEMDGNQKKDVEEEVGLGLRESRNYWGSKYKGSETEGGDGRGLWWSAKRELEGEGRWKGGVEGFEVLDLDVEKEKERESGEMVPQGAVFGVKYQSVCINIPRYLDFMLQRAKEAGARVIQADVDVHHGLEGVVQDSKRILMETDSSVKEEHIFALINCTGLGARHFVRSEEAAKLFPIRGQTMLVKGEAKKARTYIGFGGEDELVYVIPRPGSGTTILGGCKQVGNWSAEVDEELNERILERIKKWGMAEELRTKGKGDEEEFGVLSYQVGLRPGRKGGPRVEAENGGKVEGCWVVHNYGQSGGGYQCSVGCGERVAEIVARLQ